MSTREDETDPRVDAVRAVLAGGTVADVAREYEVSSAVLHRWVTAFVDAGTERVTNRPRGDDHRQRDRYLAAFAHEIRTPLTSARGWVSVLRDDELPPAMLAATLARVDDSLTRLAERARDVELLASASLGLVRLDPAPVGVAELAAAYDLPVVDEATAAMTVVVDAELLGRALRDLGGAARLAPAPASVVLEASRLDHWLELRVVRRGHPLETAVLQTLFEPFALNSDGSGITIGLYLARALAVVHGGTVGVDQDDRSTTFWVRVPERGAAAPQRADEVGTP